jgi:hypothetical protein
VKQINLENCLSNMIAVHADLRIRYTPWFTLYGDDCWRTVAIDSHQGSWFV